MRRDVRTWKKKESVGQRKNRESEQKLPKSVAKSYLLSDNSIKQNSGRKHFRLVSHVADANRNSSRTRIATSYRSDAATGRKGVRKPCASTERRMITKRFLEGGGPFGGASATTTSPTSVQRPDLSIIKGENGHPLLTNANEPLVHF